MKTDVPACLDQTTKLMQFFLEIKLVLAYFYDNIRYHDEYKQQIIITCITKSSKFTQTILARVFKR